MCRSAIVRYLIHRRVGQATPTFFRRLGLANLRELFGQHSFLKLAAFGGEPFPDEVPKWRHPRNETRLLNLYGVTEVSSWATCAEWKECNQ